MANPVVEIYVDPSKQTRTSCTITTSSTTATVNQTGHGYSTSDTIKIQGETTNPTVLNGYHVITYIDADNYSYTITSIADAPGTGTILASKMNLSGDDGTTDALAWADIQYCLNTDTRDGTHGNRINVKAQAVTGASEVLVASLDVSTWGTPDTEIPLQVCGYTSTPGDGGVGVVDCGGFGFNAVHWKGSSFQYLELHNGPGAGGFILRAGNYGVVSNCYIHDADGGGIINETYSSISFNRIEDVGEAAIKSNLRETVYVGNYIKQGASRTMTCAFELRHLTGVCINNIISVDSTTDGFKFATAYSANHFIGNTIYSNGGTGKGINLASANNIAGATIVNNYIEGFSGTGGIGIYVSDNSTSGGIWGGNVFYNCATNVTDNNENSMYLGSDESLSNSGIAKSGADTYANRFTFFKPVSEGNMLTGGYPEAL